MKCKLCEGKGYIEYEDGCHTHEDDCWKCLGTGKIKNILLEKCDCELKIKHVKGEHDWCCQLCGGSHSERICPMNNISKESIKDMETIQRAITLAFMEMKSAQDEYNDKKLSLIFGLLFGALVAILVISIMIITL